MQHSSYLRHAKKDCMERTFTKMCEWIREAEKLVNGSGGFWRNPGWRNFLISVAARKHRTRRNVLKMIVTVFVRVRFGKLGMICVSNVPL